MGSSESEEKSKENVVRCQGTFSKRRTSLVRKAHEMSVFCDVDVGVVTFSPSGPVHKFFSGEKLMEDVLERYIKLPSDKRYQHVSCLEWKLRRIREYDHIRGDKNKIFHLDNQIKNLELQIKKTTVELEILQTNLKEHELENEEDAPLTRILFCEKNLQHTLQEIKDRKERLVNDKQPSIEQTRPQVMQRSLDRQTPFASNFTARNWESQKLNSNLLMQHDLRTFPYSSRVNNGMLEQLYQRRRISLGLTGASNIFGFNPLATSYPPIYHHGNPYLTQQTAIPPGYPPIQTHPGIENLQFGMYGNSSIHQRIMGDPAIPYVPYQPQPLGSLGTSNMYHQPIMPGIKDQQLRLGSSFSRQPMRENQITPSIPNQQLGASGGSFMNQFLKENGNMTSNVQFQPQQHGVLGSTSVGQQANNEPSAGQGNQMPTSNQNNNPLNVASTVPPTSHLHVDPNQMNMLCNPNYNTIQNLDVTPLLNFESPNYNTSQNLDMNFESSDFNIDWNLDVTPHSNSESVSYEAFLNNPTNGEGDSVNNDNIENSTTNSNNNTIGNIDKNEKENYQEPESPNTIFFNSLLDEAAKEAGTNINNTIGNTDTNEKENPQPESPDTIFFNSLLNEHAMKVCTSESAVNKEESNSMELEGFVLPDNISLEDFEMLF